MFIVKKLFASLIGAMVFLVSSVCFAETLPDSEVSLGGIPFHSSQDYVRGIYGEPTKEKVNQSHYWENATEWEYGDSVWMVFQSLGMSAMTVTANNGFSTPAGAYVGMQELFIRKLYGAPSYTGPTSKPYDRMYFYRSEQSPRVGIRFDCKNGRVAKIAIGVFD